MNVTKAAMIAGLLLGMWGSSDLHAQPAVRTERIGQAAGDSIDGAAILPDGSVVVAGTFDAKQPEGKKNHFLGGKGEVFLYPVKGERVSLASVDGTITDLEADGDGAVFVTGSFGSAKIDSKNRKVLWKSPIGASDAKLTGQDEGQIARIAPGPKGGAVVLVPSTVGKRRLCRVQILDSEGKPVRDFEVPGDFVNDIAYDPKSDLVFVCGFDNKKGVDANKKPGPVQVAFVRAYNPDGKQAWKAYEWAGQEMFDTRLLADTRAYRIALGGDGKLYVAGETAGGNAMWHQMGDDLKVKAPFLARDQFQRASNTAAAHLTAVVRMEPATGKVELATILVARGANAKGSTIRPRAIAANKEGTVLVAGWSSDSPPKSKGSFGTQGEGAYMIVLDKSFERTLATTVADGASWVRGAGLLDDRFVLVGTTPGKLATLDNDPGKPDPNGDGFVIIGTLPKRE